MLVTLVVVLSTCFLGLLFISVPLSRQHELITHRLKARLIQLIVDAVELTAHILILRLEQSDVLVGRFLVVEEAADSGAFFVFDDFFFEDFQL